MDFVLTSFSTVFFSLQSENVSRDTEKLIDNVGTALLSKMMVDQDPYGVQTRSIYMELNRLSPRSLKTNKNFTKDDKAGFKFSLTAITDDKATDAQYIDTVVSCLHFVPHMTCQLVNDTVHRSSYNSTTISMLRRHLTSSSNEGRGTI